MRAADADTVVYLDGNGPPFPIALFAAAYAGVPFLPVNYRLSGQQLDGILARRAKPLVITGTPDRVPSITTMLTDEFVRRATVRAQPGSTGTDWHAAEIDPDDIAVLLMTSGTTAAPKSAVLRHRHLTSYVLETVEFASAADEATRPSSASRLTTSRRWPTSSRTSMPGAASSIWTEFTATGMAKPGP